MKHLRLALSWSSGLSYGQVLAYVLAAWLIGLLDYPILRATWRALLEIARALTPGAHLVRW